MHILLTFWNAGLRENERDMRERERKGERQRENKYFARFLKKRGNEPPPS